MKWLLPLLLLTGCGPKTPRVEAFADRGWLGEACKVALEDPQAQDPVLEAHLASAPTIHLGPADLPPPRPGAEQPADWVGLQAHWQVDSPIALETDLFVDATGGPGPTPKLFAPCAPATCHAGWVAKELGYEEPEALGLFAALVSMAKVIALPFAVTYDLATLPLRLTTLLPGVEAPPVLSFRLLESMSGEDLPDPPEGFPAVWSAPRCVQGPCERLWVARTPPAEADTASSQPDAPTARIQVSWLHDGCAVTARWDLPLESTGTIDQQLQALTADGLDLASRPPTHTAIKGP